jgi:L-ascorbate metabolism protein UlaG (beta-lactamase superfamily)
LFLFASALAAPLVTVPTAAGPLELTLAYHATLRFQLGATTLWIDPWAKAPLDGVAPGDLVLITDVHFDHLDPAALAKVRGPQTQLVAPKAVADQLPGVQHVLANGQTATVGPFTITAVPMYNLVRGPETGGKFHDPGRGNGYLVTVGGKTIYVAGDTECTPEMKALKRVDHAFVPMNLPYTMPPEEAAACVKAFAPAHVTPIHYAGSDLAVFAAGLADAPAIAVDRIDAYPGGLPW